MNLEKCMSFESLKRYENLNWKLICQWTTISDIIKALDNSEFAYKDQCTIILASIDKNKYDAQLSCDNCLIIDKNPVLYARYNNTSEMLENFVNVIRVKSKDLKPKTIEMEVEVEDVHEDVHEITSEDVEDTSENISEEKSDECIII